MRYLERLGFANHDPLVPERRIQWMNGLSHTKGLLSLHHKGHRKTAIWSVLLTVHIHKNCKLVGNTDNKLDLLLTERPKYFCQNLYRYFLEEARICVIGFGQFQLLYQNSCCHMTQPMAAFSIWTAMPCFYRLEIVLRLLKWDMAIDFWWHFWLNQFLNEILQ